MEKMLYVARILAAVIREAEVDFMADIPIFMPVPYDMIKGTRLRMSGKRYIELKVLWHNSDIEEAVWGIQEDEKDLSEYDKENNSNKLAGVLLCNTTLDEFIYELGMLKSSTNANKKVQLAKELIEKIHRIAVAFNMTAVYKYEPGGFYFYEDKKPLDDGTFICETMAEVTVRYLLMQGADFTQAMEESGMSKEEFKAFRERLKQHEINQTVEMPRGIE